MKSQIGDTASFILGGITGFGIGLLIASWLLSTEIKEIRTTAIEHQCAIHDPITGNFTWVDATGESGG